jgi:hypothetical protein
LHWSGTRPSVAALTTCLLRSGTTRGPVLLALISYAAMVLSMQAGPTISHFAPHALVPGKKTVLSFSGSGLESATNFWCSAGGTARRVASSNADTISFEVTCPENVRGVQALQIAGPDGASSYQLVLIDALRAQPHQNNHQSRTNAHRITPPAAVDCILKSEKIDYYVFTAKTGERFSIEAIAHRMGSEMDPVIHVLDADGRELMVCDDEPGVWRDSRFVFTAPSAADYLLAVHDSGYGGGTSYGYRLRVTHEPLVWFTYPLVDAREIGTSFEPFGSDTDRTEVGSPANPATGPLLFALPSLGELEINDSGSQAQPLFVPAILNGKINCSSDLDYYRFTAAKDEKLIFQSATRSLGSPCDLVLAIKNGDGKTLIQSDPALPSDAALTNKFETAGDYFLEVRELSGSRDSSNLPYRIKASRFESGFTAASEENRVELTPGGTAKLKITCARYEDIGRISFTIEPLIAGITLENAEIPEKKNEAELTIKASDDLAPGFWTHFKLKGTDSSGTKAMVSTRPALRKNFPLILNSPAVLDGLFSLTVKSK